MGRLSNLSIPPLCLVPSFPFSSPYADWLLPWPRLRGVPTNSVGTGRECDYTLRSHWQISLVFIRQAGHRGSKRLLTLMIWVCFLFPTPRTCFQGTAALALVQKMTSSEGDQQGLHRQMVIRSNNEYLQVWAQTNACYPSGQWSLSVKDAFIGSRGIHQQKASIPSIVHPQLFVTQFTKMPFLSVMLLSMCMYNVLRVMILSSSNPLLCSCCVFQEQIIPG